MQEIIHRVYYNETDKMGRVYHANFLNWMEEARTEYIRNHNLNYKKMEENGILLPVSEISIKYLAPVEYDDEVCIVTDIIQINKVKVTFKYEFYNKLKNIKFGEAESINVFTDKNGKIKKVDTNLIDKIKGGK